MEKNFYINMNHTKYSYLGSCFYGTQQQATGIKILILYRKNGHKVVYKKILVKYFHTSIFSYHPQATKYFRKITIKIREQF